MAAHIEIDESVTEINLSTRVEVLRIDESRQLSFIQSLESWQSVLDIAPLVEGDVLWGKLSISNQAAQTLDSYLVMANPGLNKLDWYVLDSKNRIRYSHFTGTDRVDALHQVKAGRFLLPVSFQPLETLSVYFKLADDGPMVMPLTLVSESQLKLNEQQIQLLEGFICGGLIVLASYFMVAYILRRSPVRFWYASSCIAALLLFLNLQGNLTQWLGLVPYISSFTTGLLAMTLLCLVKVSHSVLQPVSAYWRYSAYVLCGALLVFAVMSDAYWQLIFTTSISSAILMIQLLLGVRSIRRGNRLPSRLFIGGWLIICVVGIAQSTLYLNGIIVDRQINIGLILLVLAGGLILALANEAFEQAVKMTYQHQQDEIITDLKQFYQLVHYSAEGLYSATLEGQLISVNPAMAQLFGYESEQQMLNEVKNTRQLYRNEEDRKKLIKELHHKGIVFRREIQGNKRDGSEFWFSNSVQMQQEDEQQLLFGSVVDITERKHSNLSMAYLASHDSVTGMYNHREFERRLTQALQYTRQSNGVLSLLLIEIEQFEQVNETCGYEAANILLQQLSHKMHQVISSRAMLARLNSNQFAILLEGEQAIQSMTIAEQLQQIGEEFVFVWDKRHVDIGTHIGLAHYDKNTKSVQQLISMANSACNSAQQQGSNQIHNYSHQGEELTHFQTDQNWLSMLNQALENNKFELYFQHYHPLKTSEARHQYEILLRMNTDIQDNIISPTSFLPSAERHNLMAMIDGWVIEHYFQWLSAHPEHLAQLERCNINLSGYSLADNDLKLFVLNAFEQYAIPYEKICFELTESDAMVRMDDTLKFIKTFANLGCSFALDDFGNEFSSYSNLKNLPVHFVKIDGELIKDLLIDSVDSAMVRSIHDIASAVGVKTIAEFVESKDIMVELGKLGVDYAQGYAIAKPQPLSQFSAYQHTE
ncbi:EAL domain-containing protein [Neptunicella sp. SCSIO 80796]|uniref:EAL domain-containing protein n=1 Tax=Neptunicella plasticusilytica TaxID=3117012 RepID=UPI003A4DFEF8